MPTEDVDIRIRATFEDKGAAQEAKALAQGFDKTADKAGEAAKSSIKLTRSVDKLGKEAKDTSRALKVGDKETKDLRKSFDKMNRSASTLTRKFDSFGDSVQTTSGHLKVNIASIGDWKTKLLTNINLVTAGVGVLSGAFGKVVGVVERIQSEGAKLGALNSAMKRIKASTRGTADEMNSLKVYFKELSRSASIGEARLARAFAKYVSVGASQRQAAEALIQTLNLARDSGIEFEEVVEGIWDAYKASPEGLTKWGVGVAHLTQMELARGEAVKEIQKIYGENLIPLQRTDEFITDIKNKWEIFTGILYKSLGKSKSFSYLMQTASEFLGRMIDNAPELGEWVDEIVKKIAILFVDIRLAMINITKKAYELLGIWLKVQAAMMVFNVLGVGAAVSATAKKAGQKGIEAAKKGAQAVKSKAASALPVSARPKAALGGRPAGTTGSMTLKKSDLAKSAPSTSIPPVVKEQSKNLKEISKNTSDLAKTVKKSSVAPIPVKPPKKKAGFGETSDRSVVDHGPKKKMGFGETGAPSSKSPKPMRRRIGFGETSLVPNQTQLPGSRPPVPAVMPNRKIPRQKNEGVLQPQRAIPQQYNVGMRSELEIIRESEEIAKKDYKRALRRAQIKGTTPPKGWWNKDSIYYKQHLERVKLKKQAKKQAEQAKALAKLKIKKQAELGDPLAQLKLDREAMLRQEKNFGAPSDVNLRDTQELAYDRLVGADKDGGLGFDILDWETEDEPRKLRRLINRQHGFKTQKEYDEALKKTYDVRRGLFPTDFRTETMGRGVNYDMSEWKGHISPSDKTQVIPEWKMLNEAHPKLLQEELARQERAAIRNFGRDLQIRKQTEGMPPMPSYKRNRTLRLDAAGEGSRDYMHTMDSLKLWKGDGIDDTKIYKEYHKLTKRQKKRVDKHINLKKKRRAEWKKLTEESEKEFDKLDAYWDSEEGRRAQVLENIKTFENNELPHNMWEDLQDQANILGMQSKLPKNFNKHVEWAKRNKGPGSKDWFVNDAPSLLPVAGKGPPIPMWTPKNPITTPAPKSSPTPAPKPKKGLGLRELEDKSKVDVSKLSPREKELYDMIHNPPEVKTGTAFGGPLKGLLSLFGLGGRAAATRIGARVGAQGAAKAAAEKAPSMIGKAASKAKDVAKGTSGKAVLGGVFTGVGASVGLVAAKDFGDMVMETQRQSESIEREEKALLEMRAAIENGTYKMPDATQDALEKSNEELVGIQGELGENGTTSKVLSDLIKTEEDMKIAARQAHEANIQRELDTQKFLKDSIDGIKENARLTIAAIRESRVSEDLQLASPELALIRDVLQSGNEVRVADLEALRGLHDSVVAGIDSENLSAAEMLENLSGLRSQLESEMEQQQAIFDQMAEQYKAEREALIQQRAEAAMRHAAEIEKTLRMINSLEELALKTGERDVEMIHNLNQQLETQQVGYQEITAGIDKQIAEMDANFAEQKAEYKAIADREIRNVVDVAQRAAAQRNEQLAAMEEQNAVVAQQANSVVRIESNTGEIAKEQKEQTTAIKEQVTQQKEANGTFKGALDEYIGNQEEILKLAIKGDKVAQETVKYFKKDIQMMEIIKDIVDHMNGSLTIGRRSWKTIELQAGNFLPKYLQIAKEIVSEQRATRGDIRGLGSKLSSSGSGSSSQKEKTFKIPYPKQQTEESKKQQPNIIKVGPPGEEFSDEYKKIVEDSFAPVVESMQKRTRGVVIGNGGFESMAEANAYFNKSPGPEMSKIDKQIKRGEEAAAELSRIRTSGTLLTPGSWRGINDLKLQSKIGDLATRLKSLQRTVETNNRRIEQANETLTRTREKAEKEARERAEFFQKQRREDIMTGREAFNAYSKRKEVPPADKIKTPTQINIQIGDKRLADILVDLQESGYHGYAAAA